MPKSLIVQALLSFTFIVCLVAVRKGGEGERVGALLIAINTLTDLAFGGLPNLAGNPVAKLTLDGVTALVFAGMAIRYTSKWLGAVMLLYAGQFALNAYYFVMDRAHDLAYVKANNAIFLLICISLAAGVIGHLRAQKAASPAI